MKAALVVLSKPGLEKFMQSTRSSRQRDVDILFNDATKTGVKVTKAHIERRYNELLVSKFETAKHVQLLIVLVEAELRRELNVRRITELEVYCEGPIR